MNARLHRCVTALALLALLAAAPALAAPRRPALAAVEAPRAWSWGSPLPKLITFFHLRSTADAEGQPAGKGYSIDPDGAAAAAQSAGGAPSGSGYSIDPNGKGFSIDPNGQP